MATTPNEGIVNQIDEFGERGQKLAESITTLPGFQLLREQLSRIEKGIAVQETAFFTREIQTLVSPIIEAFPALSFFFGPEDVKYIADNFLASGTYRTRIDEGDLPPDAAIDLHEIRDFINGILPADFLRISAQHITPPSPKLPRVEIKFERYN